MRTILVVDDEFGIAETLQLLLEDEGYRVVTASNGRQGLQRLTDGVPDLVLLDYMMPGLDGPGMLSALREDLTYRDIPVIMMTALPEATVVAEAGTLGYSAFLRKPFRANEVLDLAARVLDGKKP